jgi:hypothetical protein
VQRTQATGAREFVYLSSSDREYMGAR